MTKRWRNSGSDHIDLCSPVITRISHMKMLRAEGGEGGTDIGTERVLVHDNVRHHLQRIMNLKFQAQFCLRRFGFVAPILGIACTA